MHFQPANKCHRMSETNDRIRILYHLARADFLERVRRYSFVLTMGISIYLGYAATTGQLEMRVGDSRGVFNSAWIGGLMALVCSTFLSLAGFYVVKNTIERDRLTRVGEILASTPMSKTLYVMGKVLSNFLVLAVMVVILAISGIIMQVWHAEAPRVDLWKLLGPFLLIVIPAMALVAAVAVLFETVPGLRGGFGNVLYFFVWSVALAVPISASENNRSSFFDWAGLSVIWSSIGAAARLPANHFSFSLSIGSGNQARVGSTFQWNGVEWTPELILGRLSWIAVALAFALLAALLFDRFDPSKERSRRAISAPAFVPIEVAENLLPARKPIHAPPLKPLANRRSHFRFGAIFLAELRLMLKGQKWWWYAVAAGLIAACAATPSASARGTLLACAWFWPVLIWSKMGVRETREQTSQLIFSAPHPIARQLPAVWLAGVGLALLTGSGFGGRLLFTENWRGLLAWLIGALFIPTLALTFGVWSGSSKLFEIVYTLLWYVGPMHATLQLDFMGSAPGTEATRVPSFYFACAAAMAAIAILGRKRQLQT
jgi:cytochrome b subunit of formate dehydrogenase